MGEVWSAIHHRIGTPVAVKFLTAEGLQQPDFLRAFRVEARAVAALDHPGIVRVHDYGEVDTGTTVASRGRIPEGTPWLAMERVDSGTLLPLVGRLRWQELHSVVLTLLDALAHAHARGVIHRDLKPGNVLVTGQPDPDSLAVKLTDFGLAQAVDERGELDIPFAGGTPSYMAPEQFEGRWRDFGPWSDLYAFGTLIWSLATGQPPFGPPDGSDKRRQHLRVPPPPLKATIPVPPRFETWLRTLLEKDPRRRYRRAADARDAFAHLGSPYATPLPPGRTQGKLPTGSNIAEVPTLTFDEDPDGTVRFPLGPATTPIPPFAPSWHPGHESQPVSPHGLGLFGLRPIPLVGRTRERDALWAHLSAVHRHRQVHAVLVRGSAGVGKTRLARWLAERAHETGTGVVLHARHRSTEGPDQGLGPMLRGFLRCHDMERERVLGRIGAIYKATGVEHKDEWHALTEVICPAIDEETAKVRFTSPVERHITVRRLLQTAALERPVIVVLDEAHNGIDALRFTSYLLQYRARHDLPILLLLTLTDEELAERLDAATLVEELLEHERCSALAIGPLPAEDRPALVTGILGLEAELAARVDNHTRGNPQFAVELVADWVRSGLLTPSGEGYRAVQELHLPRDLDAMWSSRVHRLQDRLSAPLIHALELAATLGMNVDGAEWVGACARAERAEPADHLLDVLVEEGLAETRITGDGFAFTHNAARDAILALAERDGRLVAWHALCARLLEDQVRRLPSWPAGLSERVGRHWLGAGEPGTALTHLLEGIIERRESGDHAIAESLLVAYERALRDADIPESDPRWGQGWMQRLELAGQRGHRQEADRWLRLLLDEGKQHDWTALERRAQLYHGHILRKEDAYERALEVLSAVERNAARGGDRELMARARQEIGDTLLESGDVDGSERWLRLALAEYRATDDDLGCARCWRSLGDALAQKGAYEEANELLVQAERLLTAAGHRHEAAKALNSRGEVARARGDLRLAAKLYRRARGLLKAIGSSAWVVPEYNRGLLYLAVEDYGRARPILELSLHRFTADEKHAAVAHAHLALACCAAQDATWLLFDEHLREAAAILQRTGGADEDTARIAENAGQAAKGAGHLGRALEAWTLARAQWRTLKRPDEQRRVEGLLSHLGA